MTIETRTLFISFDQPRRALNALRTMLQQALAQSSIHAASFSSAWERQQVVIVDSVDGRAQFIARLVSAAGYRPLVASGALDAFTLFLQGSLVPIVILLSQEERGESLFLLRLQQQTLHRYQWDVPFIRLHTEPTHKAVLQIAGPTPGAPLRLPQSTRQTQPGRNARPEIRSSLTPTRLQSSGLLADAIAREKTGPMQPLRHAPAQARVDTMPLAPSTPLPLPVAQVVQPVFPPPQYSPVLTEPLSMPPQAAAAMSATQLQSGSVEQKTIIEVHEVEKKNLEGQNLGRFQIMHPLGGSVVGDVYRAYDRLRETSIAFKSIQSNVLPDGFLNDVYVNTNLFQQEVDLLAIMKHPHILRVLSAGKSYISGTPFYYKTMPHYQDSLAAWRVTHGNTRPLSLQETLPIARQLAGALHYAHEHHILYQNFKFTNILLEGESGDDTSRLHLLLADFALVGENKHALRTPEGLRYLAPEQWHHESLPASDQYGLAAILYELLTGRPPFQGNQEHLLRHMHLSMQPQPPSAFNATVSHAADGVLLRALSKNPQDRFGSVATFARAFQACA